MDIENGVAAAGDIGIGKLIDLGTRVDIGQMFADANQAVYDEGNKVGQQSEYGDAYVAFALPEKK